MNATQRMVLAFESQWNRRYGDKYAAITTELGLSPAVYEAILDSLIDLPEAIITAPATVSRRRRLRDVCALRQTRSPIAAARLADSEGAG